MSVRFATWFVLSALAVKSVFTSTAEERKKIVQYHNDEREKVMPTAANMQLLTYSNEMEKLAASWVANCKFQHPNPSTHPEYRGVGQNLALFGGMPSDIYKSSVQMWSKEKANYKYSTNNCTGVCGHYTQVVWAATTVVGCAWKFCSDNKPGYSQGYLLACQYKPPGNMFRLRPYVSGKICSQCAEKDYCVKNQCSKHKGSGSVNKLALSSLSVLLFACILN